MAPPTEPAPTTATEEAWDGGWGGAIFWALEMLERVVLMLGTAFECWFAGQVDV